MLHITSTKTDQFCEGAECYCSSHWATYLPSEYHGIEILYSFYICLLISAVSHYVLACALYENMFACVSCMFVCVIHV